MALPPRPRPLVPGAGPNPAARWAPAPMAGFDPEPRAGFDPGPAPSAVLAEPGPEPVPGPPVPVLVRPPLARSSPITPNEANSGSSTGAAMVNALAAASGR